MSRYLAAIDGDCETEKVWMFAAAMNSLIQSLPFVCIDLQTICQCSSIRWSIVDRKKRLWYSLDQSCWFWCSFYSPLLLWIGMTHLYFLRLEKSEPCTHSCHWCNFILTVRSFTAGSALAKMQGNGLLLVQLVCRSKQIPATAELWHS